MVARLKLDGKKFGRLSVLHSVKAHPTSKWRCVCDCGNIKDVESYFLTHGLTKSCGCLHRETSRENGKNTAKHNMCKSPEYQAWAYLKRICDKHNVFLDHSIRDDYTVYASLLKPGMALWTSNESIGITLETAISIPTIERLRILRRRLALGTSVKKGRVEITVGEHKFRKMHCVIAEENIIGRRMRSDEVVHHIDGNPMNNDVSNLVVMTRAEHASLHAKLDIRSRNELGQFI